MLFNKITLCAKAWFVGFGFFLFNTEDSFIATSQKFVVKDVVTFGFQNF